MMLSFPLPMPPELRVESLTFELSSIAEDAPSTERGGRTTAADLGPAIWQASWQTDALSPAEHGVVSGWLDALGGINRFYGYDHTRPYPIACPGGFTDLFPDWSGTGALVSVASSRVVTISGIPAGFALAPRDYLVFGYGVGGRALHRACAPAMADAAGVLQVEVRPFVRLGWAAGAAVHFAYASAHMTVLTKTVRHDITPARRARVSFSAIQSI